MMKQILYSEEDYKLLRQLLVETPVRIIGDGGGLIVFDFGRRHIYASPKDFLAATQNENGEAIGVRLREGVGRYRLDNMEKVLFKAQPIEKIWILRTILYFSDYVTFNSKEEALAGMKEPETETEEKLYNFFSQMAGGYELLFCHPLAEEAGSINPAVSNLVDAGFVAQIGEDMLSCFAEGNGFWLPGNILSPKEMAEEFGPIYQFIELNRSEN